MWLYPNKTKKIILIVVAIVAVYGVLQIINSIVNKEAPPVDYKPNQLTEQPTTSSNTGVGNAWLLNAENGTYEFYRAPEA